MTSRTRRFVTYGCLLLTLQPQLAAIPAWAASPPATTQLPTGGNVTSGAATIASSGATMNVTETSQKAIINWNTFDIGAQAQVNFIQPNASAQILNRVASANASQIYGKITANGQVFLINPNGVVFGAGSQVNAAGLVASTLDISDQDFLNNNDQFQATGSNGSVTNQGTLTAASGGYVALLGNNVSNLGTINAPNGKAVLAAGGIVQIPLTQNGLISLDISAGDASALVSNGSGGTINAPGGQVYLAAEASPGYAASVSNHGAINADQVQATSQSGDIFIDTDSSVSAQNIEFDAAEITGAGSLTATSSVVLNGGYISLAGAIHADNAAGAGGSVAITGGSAVLLSSTSSISANGKSGGHISIMAAQGFTLASGIIQAIGSNGLGGQVDLTGASSVVLLGASVNASGATGGGAVNIGGDWHGGGTLLAAASSFVDTASVINADATLNGNGGQVVLWSTQGTSFYGNITARGGINGGNGGEVELSSAQALNVQITGSNGVNVLARYAGGSAGTVTLDPANIVIGSGDSIQPLDIFEALVGGGGTLYSPTGSAIITALGSGSDFGSAVALNDTYALIGAQGVANSEGDAYLFNLASGAWTDLATTANNPITSLGSNAYFGNAVAINAAYALIGAYGVAGVRGDAYLYDLSNGIWIDLATTANNPITSLGSYAAFAQGLALNSGYALIGATYAGDAYLFNLTNGSWLDLATTANAPQNSLSGAYFGANVALNENYALIGAYGLSNERGGAYLYNLTSGAWTDLATTNNQPITALGDDSKFGAAVALNGSYALIGAYGASTNQGDAYLYNLNTGSWTDLATTGSQPVTNLATFSYFGVSVALNNNYALIGANGVSSERGDAFLYNLGNGAWTDLATTADAPVTGLSGLSEFGAHVALNDNIALISAAGVASDRGNAYLYNLNSGAWTDLGASYTQPITGLSSNAQFGYSVAINGNYALIGATTTGPSSQGDAYLYNLANGAWTDLATTSGQPITSLGYYSAFGSGVALNGTYALIGASGVGTNAEGDAYLYNLTNGAWTDLAQTANQPITGLNYAANFGYAVALNDTMALIGAYGVASNRGDAYLYNLSNGTWTDLATTSNQPITALSSNSYFGVGVALSNSYALLGAIGAGSSGQGDAYLYKISDGSWLDLATTANEPTSGLSSGASFGQGLALNGSYALISAYSAAGGRGDAYLYNLSTSAWTDLATTNNQPVTGLSTSANFGDAVALNSSYALIGAQGAGGSGQGDAYLYNLSSGNWTDLGTTTNAPSGALSSGATFGYSVALSDRFALIGAAGVSSSRGDAYIYDLGSGAWLDLAAGQPIASLSSGAQFGQSVAIDSAYALIGASGIAGAQGDAYLYNLASGGWIDLAATLDEPITSLSGGAHFGDSVALNGSYALIGAAGAASGQGDAYLYNIGTGIWTDLAASGGAPGLAANAAFGSAVALNNTYALIGASGVASSRGDAYLYDIGTGGWVDLAATGSQPVTGLAASSAFGSSVALSSAYALIGADGVASGRGDAYLYNLSSGGWTNLAATGSEPVTGLAASASFGSAVALNGSYALIGADGVSGGRGDAYLYNLGSGGWIDLATINGQPVTALAANASFGSAVALNNGYALIGASGVASGEGDAYLYNLSSGLWTDMAAINGQPITALGAGAGFGASVALSDTYALVGSPQAGVGGNAYLIYLPFVSSQPMGASYISQDTIAAGLATGNYRIVADNNLTIDSLFLQNTDTGNSLTLEAGGSIDVAANVTFGDRSVTLIANGADADLGNAANRVAGGAGITIESYASLDDGSGNLTLQIGTAASTGRSGAAATAGAFNLLGDINAGSVVINGGESAITVAANITSSNSGVAITLNGLSDTISGALTANNGNWLVYNSNASALGTISLGGNVADFDRYGCSYGGGCTTGASIPASGNGIVYAYAPTLTLSSTDTNKTYDSTRTASLSGITITGAVNGDSISLTSATYASADVGNGIAISYGQATNYGYLLSGSALTGAITPASITVSGVTANNKAYDGNVSDTLNVSAATLAGVFNSDNVTVTAGSGVFADANPGTGKAVTATGFTLGGTKAEDYQISPLPTGLTADITGSVPNNNNGGGNNFAPAPVSATPVTIISALTASTNVAIANEFFPSESSAGIEEGDNCQTVASDGTAAGNVCAPAGGHSR